MSVVTALTIAGSDPSGGAGIQADLKVFHQFGAYGMAVVSLLTVQNTQTVHDVRCLDPEFVAAQTLAVLEDIPPLAAKTGALGSKEIISKVALLADNFPFPLVVDPVLISKHGARLLEKDAESALRDSLLPRSFLLTPNIPEAELLSGIKIKGREDIEKAATKILSFGAKNLLIKGGHLVGDSNDYLFCEKTLIEFPSSRISTKNTHGTGCSYSAAITACLAHGLELKESVTRAKSFIFNAISSNPQLGRGCGPVNHFAHFEIGESR